MDRWLGGMFKKEIKRTKIKIKKESEKKKEGRGRETGRGG